MDKRAPYTIEELICEYQMYVSDIDEEGDGIYHDLFHDAVFALIERDSLKDRWEELSQEEQAEVLKLDDELRHKGRLMEDILPLPSSTEENRQAGRWWWFIDEYSHGPSDDQGDLTQERHNGPTPNGGVYSIGYFSDADYKPVPKELAVYVEIHEFNEDGQCIYRTYGVTETDHLQWSEE
jgi:hypothetical protein